MVEAIRSIHESHPFLRGGIGLISSAVITCLGQLSAMDVVRNTGVVLGVLVTLAMLISYGLDIWKKWRFRDKDEK